MIYLIEPGAIVQALDGANGDLLWEYKRKLANPAAGQTTAKTKALAIYQDIVLYTATDGFIVGLDARTGEQRWQTATGTATNIPARIVVEGKTITGRLRQERATPASSAHTTLSPARSLEVLHTFPRPASRARKAGERIAWTPNLASTWGLPGTYDPVRKQLYWGIANAMPNTRLERHGGIPTALRAPRPPTSTATRLCRSNPDTGKLNWYYQHLPGDDWDQDYTHERTLVRAKFNPGSEVCEMVQSRRQARRGARHGGDGRRRRRHFRARPR